MSNIKILGGFMIVLSCTNINKSFGTTEILKDISFSINAGERIGLIGRNGAGKTTLFKILCNNLDFDSGNIFTSKDSSLGYLKQSTSYGDEIKLYDFCLEVFNDIIEMENKLRYYEQEIADNAEKPEVLEHAMRSYSELTDTFANLNGYAYKSEVRGILFGLGFEESDFDRPITQFSGGQQSRISIAKLLLTKPNILLLDEPTNHLDINAVKWLESYLKNYDGTIILISHDRYFLDQVTTKIYEIENCQLLMNPGNYSDFLKFKTERYQSLKKQYEEQQREIKEQEKLISSFKERGTEKLAKRARSREKRLDMVDRLDNPMLVNERAKLKFSTQENSGNDVLFIEDLSKSFDEQPIFKNINMNVYRSEKIGLIGKNGVGKTTLFRTIMDTDFKTSGEIKFGHNVNLGYYSQDQLELTSSNNLVDELALANPN
jgi:ATP-binding cassette subfamily F protein 3